MNQGLPPSAITRSLKTKCIGKKVVYLPSVTSTMDAARGEALKGAAEGTVIIAGEQTAGRGRLKRKWLTPQGNIALSVILHPGIAGLPCLIMIASLAVAQSIESVSGLKTQIKWPNDVLIDGKKVCGILIENEVRGDKVAYSIVGIGINVDLKVNDFTEIASTAASLKSEPGNEELRIELIRALLQELDKLYVNLPDGKDIFKAWRDRLVTLGKHVKAQSGAQIIEGIAEAVDDTGALVIRQADGTLTKAVAGDVTLRS